MEATHCSDRTNCFPPEGEDHGECRCSCEPCRDVVRDAAYAVIWDQMEEVRTGLGTPNRFDYAIRIAQSLIAEKIGYADRVEAQRAHEARRD